ncbi:ribonuclease H-like domain-containing protein [Tanacetum coccineum]|uniref:Ribonuclease H-like domain-containing protein n=1 Tax=Tanacetum coccineum TaxID=301880 RepID=A0ABQ5HIJ3_9ASTR
MSTPNSVHNTPIISEHGDDYVEDPDPITRISKLDVSDPLHLHPNDSSALIVVSIKLKGTENYQVWSCAMLLALEGKNKTGFIDGSCKRSKTDEILGRQWDGVNAVVLGWILNSISKELFLGQIFSKKAKHVWEKLKETYDKCVCNASEGFKKHNQLMKLMQFLMGLDDSYMQIRSSILSREVLPDVRSAYATISSEESHRVASSSVSGSSQMSQASAFVSNVPNRNNFQRNNQNFNTRPRPNNMNNNRQSGGSGFVCENCGFNGHTIDMCFKIIGYLVDFGKKKFDEQIATLLSFTKENKIGKNVQANMAGANQHMAYNDKDLDNVLDIYHLKIKVGHPNRTKAFISNIENLRLSNGLTLYDVMVISEYCVTLIFVHKMAKENKIFVVFDESKCYFVNQDLNMKNVMRTGDQCEGLYYYNEQEPVMNILKKSLYFDKPDKDLCCESVSSSSSESGGMFVTADFQVNSKNNADSSDNNFATHDEGVTTLEENVKYGIEKYVGYSKPNSENYCFITQLNKKFEPKSLSEASKFPHWIDAINQEMNALLRNGTWYIVELPKGRKAIGSKWIYNIKYQSIGEIDRFKARLVAQGFGQKKGIDYEETFFVVKMVTVRCLLNIVVSHSWPIFQLDVNNAFLYGDLDEVVYIRPPEGYFPSENRVFLKSEFMIKDLGKLKYFLGTKVFDTERGICLNQRKYVLDLLSEYGMLACKPVDTPLLSKLVISNEATESDLVLENITDYQKLMGKLIYLTNTMSDISYVVHCLSQFMHSPFKSHLKTAFKILRYLKSCPGLEIHFVKTSVKNNTLSKSSTEAEYRALASVTSEIAASLVFHERTKHLGIDLHFVKENILKGVVRTVKVDSANQIADVFTKGLGTIQHKNFLKKLGMFDIYQVKMKKGC